MHPSRQFHPSRRRNEHFYKANEIGNIHKDESRWRKRSARKLEFNFRRFVVEGLLDGEGSNCSHHSPRIDYLWELRIGTGSFESIEFPTIWTCLLGNLVTPQRGIMVFMIEPLEREIDLVMMNNKTRVIRVSWKSLLIEESFRCYMLNNLRVHRMRWPSSCNTTT